MNEALDLNYWQVAGLMGLAFCGGYAVCLVRELMMPRAPPDILPEGGFVPNPRTEEEKCQEKFTITNRMRRTDRSRSR